MSIASQYILVGVILLLCICFIAKKFIRTKCNKSSGCCGCPLKDDCYKESEPKH